jgi:FkbM family methyltransferase
MILDDKKQKTNDLEFLGSDYGGWGLSTKNLNKDIIVYSFGVGTDISFDLKLIEMFNCKVYAFDPTPRCLNWVEKQTLPHNFIFNPIGLSNIDGISYFNEPPRIDWVSYSETTTPTDLSVKCSVNKLSTIMRSNNHHNIDILKMDIEGSEYNVLENMYEEKIFPEQILVEFHGNETHKINKIIEMFNIYKPYKRFDRNDYYLIKNNV